MALEGPQLRYARVDVDEGATTASSEDALARALRLARTVEEILEDTRSARPASVSAGGGSADAAHSTRMARAVAASLVDELEALVRGANRRSA